jgi:hypothetical protein
MKILDLDCPVKDIVDTVNQGRLHSGMTLQSTLHLILDESVYRLTKFMQTRQELSSLSVTFNEAERTATLPLGYSGKSLLVRLDWDYPTHPSCMELVSVLKGKFGDLEMYQVCGQCTSFFP